jgi:hypothetical protein
MIIEFNLTNLIFILIAIFSAFWALLKMLAVLFKRDLQERFTAMDAVSTSQYQRLNTRLDELSATAKTDSGQWARVERELLTLKADLPLHYVRREDYIQAVATIMAKLDAISMRFENILLRGVKNYE